MEAAKSKILIVDDEPDFHSVVRMRLEKDGFQVFDAYDGEEALRLARQETIDIVIVDVIMPGMNGFEVCQKIKNERPNTKVIVYTAKIDGVDAGKAREVGADLFTVKTSSLVLLLASIKRLINGEKK
jgi:two-component system OmpR family response regulator